jgi:hypothetical protein
VTKYYERGATIRLIERIHVGGANNDVVKAITIHVPGTTYCPAQPFFVNATSDAEPSGAGAG